MFLPKICETLWDQDYFLGQIFDLGPTRLLLSKETILLSILENSENNNFPVP